MRVLQSLICTHLRLPCSVARPWQVFWWRVALDEAQMVGSGLGAVATMAQRLSSVHRWCARCGIELAAPARCCGGILFGSTAMKRLWFTAAIDCQRCQSCTDTFSFHSSLTV